MIESEIELQTICSELYSWKRCSKLAKLVPSYV